MFSIFHVLHFHIQLKKKKNYFETKKNGQKIKSYPLKVCRFFRPVIGRCDRPKLEVIHEEL